MIRTYSKIVVSMVCLCLFAAATQAADKNVFESSYPNLVNGAIGVDTLGHFRTTHDSSVNVTGNKLYSVDKDGIPVQFYDPANPFFLGFDAYRNLASVADPEGNLIGFMGLDKYAAVHTFTITGPSFNYIEGLADYNANQADAKAKVYLPFFGGFIDGAFVGLDLDVLKINELTGGDNAIARDIEVAVDWRSATNAFQGYYILDVFGGVHYINNPEILGLFQKDGIRDATHAVVVTSGGEAIVKEPVAYQKFFDIFNFRARYMADYVGVSPTDQDIIERAAPPYWPGLPIARDLAVMVRYEKMTAPGATEDLVSKGIKSENEAKSLGIDTSKSKLFTPIAINPNRNNISYAEFTPEVPITNGYAILDGFGGLHTLIEDAAGNPIPAPWENRLTGAMDPSVDAPWFSGFDLAVSVKIMANNGGYCLLTRTGEVYVVNAVGKTAEDNFVKPGIEKDLPSFGFDAARELNLVSNAEGKIVGMYVLDRYGTIHKAGDVPELPSRILYFPDGNASSLELSPYVHPITDAN